MRKCLVCNGEGNERMMCESCEGDYARWCGGEEPTAMEAIVWCAGRAWQFAKVEIERLRQHVEP